MSRGISLINIFSSNPLLPALSLFKIWIGLTVLQYVLHFVIEFFLHNHTLHHCWALLQSTDQLRAGLPSDQVYNNTISLSCSAAVNYLSCRTSFSPRPILEEFTWIHSQVSCNRNQHQARTDLNVNLGQNQ